MRSGRYFLLLLLLAIVVLVPVIAKHATQIKIVDSEKQFPAAVGKQTLFERNGTIQNTGQKSVDAEIKLDSKADIRVVAIDGVPYVHDTKDIHISRHKVRITMPAGKAAVFDINYTMPAPRINYKVVTSNKTDFLSRFTMSTNYEQHTHNVVGSGAVPNLPEDWSYSVYSDNNGTRTYWRYFLRDNDSDGKIEELGFIAPQLSQADGLGGGNSNKSKSKLLNYNFQQVRVDNIDLPVGWFFRESTDIKIEDEMEWKYMPFSNEGYDDNSSLLLKFIPTGGRIFTIPLNISTFSLGFSYKPKFQGCNWPLGMEVLFQDGSSDTTGILELGEDGKVYSGDDFNITSVAAVSGWYNISMVTNIPLTNRIVRFFATLGNIGGCSYEGAEVLIDNVILT